MNMTLDSTAVSMLAGAGLSLVFSYIPPLQDWYAGLDGAGKRALMCAAVLLAAGISFGLACSGWLASFGYQMSCDQPGLAGPVQERAFQNWLDGLRGQASRQGTAWMGSGWPLEGA